jgi:succinoglycan biosynthesis protein ExoM
LETGPRHTGRTDPPSNAGRILCSVLVCTYRRPDLLGKLLESLEAQVLPEGVDVEVVVVDNDPGRSGEPVVRRFTDSGRNRFSYFVQPVKNISLTRNESVRNASGEYLLFIDDDEVAPPEWLGRMLGALGTFCADGVFGPCMPEFDEETPGWKRWRDLHYRAMQSTGEKAIQMWTGNCVVRASLLKGREGPFDPAYGKTGGEDSFLFETLEREGARFVYCREAWVSEYLPPHRTRIPYMFLRGIRNGNAHTRRMIEFRGKGRIGVRLFMIAKALLYGTASLGLLIACLPVPARSTFWMIRFGSNIGRILAAAGWHPKHYR